MTLPSIINTFRLPKADPFSARSTEKENRPRFFRTVVGLVLSVSILLLSDAGLPASAWADEKSSFQNGLKAFRAGKNEQARKSLLRAVIENKRNALAYFYLGMTYNRLENPRQALKSFQFAEKINPSLPGIHLSLGTAYYKMELFEQALPHLQNAQKEDPGNGTNYFFLGRTLQELRQYEDSNHAFKRAAEIDPEYKQSAQYNIGVNQFRKGEFYQADLSFKKAQAINPDTPTGKSARHFLDSVHTGKRQEKKLWYHAGMGFEYDDNVTSSAQDQVSEEGDAAFTFDFGGGYRFYEKNQFTAEVTYDLYQSAYLDLDDFNLRSHTIDVSANRHKGPWDLAFDYIFNYNKLGGDSFLMTSGYMASAGLSWKTRYYTRVSYMIQSRNFLQAANDPRDAVDHNLGFDQFIFSRDAKAYYQISYRFINEDADAGPFDYGGHTVTLATKIPTSYQGRLRIAYTYLHKDFKNITPSIGQERRDQRHTYQLAWTRMFRERIEFRARYQHIASLSNLPAVDYSENIISFTGKYLF